MLSHKDKTPSAPAAGANTAAGGGGAAVPPSGPRRAGPGYLGAPASLWAQVVSGPPGRLTVFHFRRWEMLNEPTPNVGENDAALSLALFERAGCFSELLSPPPTPSFFFLLYSSLCTMVWLVCSALEFRPGRGHEHATNVFPDIQGPFGD